MIRFLIKGILRDRSRSLLPVIIVTIGVMLTVFLSCWLEGIMTDSIELNARINTGHLKVMSRAYAADADQIPNDLALLGADSLTSRLKNDFPGLTWVQRIRFGGLIDFPDSSRETRAQGPVAGWAIDLLSPGSGEAERFNLLKSLKKGGMPLHRGEALISDEFALKFNVSPGDTFTFFGTSMDGSMSFHNLVVSGTVYFGSAMLDRGALIMDLADARTALAMEDAAGEILGFFPGGYYDNEEATRITGLFNEGYRDIVDEYAPVMIRLRDQGGMADFVDYAGTIAGMMSFIFVLAMSVVLWNAGLLGGLRRYREFGVRLAMGEDKKHVYKTLLYEGFVIGILGSLTGTIMGLALSYYMQEVGFDMTGMMKNSSLMMPAVARAHITPAAFYIGFIPGLLSTLLGNALSGIGIYKRETSQLFKELEV
ncbi:MAG: FtsX-like permease family protein [Bacteroidales bacterium]